MPPLIRRLRTMILARTGRQPAAQSWTMANPPGTAAPRPKPGWLARLTRRSRPAADQPPHGTSPSGDAPDRNIAGRRRLAVLVVVLLSLLAGFASLRIGTIDASRLSRIPGIDSTPGGQRQAESAHYRQTLMDANSINADAADRTGSSYISIPESVPEQIPEETTAIFLPARDTITAEETDPETRTAPEPDPLAAANNVPTGDRLVAPDQPIPHDQPAATSAAALADVPPESAPPTADPGPDQYAEAMLGQMTAILRGMAISEPESVLLPRPESDLPPAAGPLPVGDLHAGFSIPAGTILQGETVNTVTSDQASPVVVEISGGEFDGARMLGRFTVSAAAGGLVVQFDRLATPAGLQFDVEAVAVDAFDSGPAVASSVDRRLVRRFGPGFMASMVTGFAESASRPAVEVVEIGGNAAVTSGTSTTRQSVIAGMGRAAQQIAGDLAGSVPAGPEIRLEAGYPVGILFVASAAIPN